MDLEMVSGADVLCETLDEYKNGFISSFTICCKVTSFYQDTKKLFNIFLKNIIFFCNFAKLFFTYDFN